MTPDTVTVDAVASQADDAVAPQDATGSKPAPDSELATEPAVATDTSATPGSPEFDPLPEAPVESIRTNSAEDAEILAAVDTSVAEGYVEPTFEPFEAPGQRTPTDAAEDADILASVDEAVAADRTARSAAPEPELEPERSAPPVNRSHTESVHTEPAYGAPSAAEPAARGGSLAGRLLAALVLLLVGAGLALWAAPKLAPRLPAGLAAWVAPADPKVATLQGELDGLKAEVAGLGSASAVADQITTATADVSTRLESEIAALKATLGTTDETSLRQRLDRVEAAVNGQTAELGTLKQQLTGAAASGTGGAQIDVYRGEIDGMRAEMGSLSDKVAGLATRVDEVAAEADRTIDTAQAKVEEVQQQASTAVSNATLQADVAEIEAAMAAGQPFAVPLERLASAPGVSVPAPLTAAANGIPSLAQLRDSFPDAAHQAIRAGILAGAGDGIFARGRAFLQAEVATRSLTPQPGRSPDAVLSRMEDKLRNGDLAAALAQSDELPAESAAAMSGWLDAARLRAGAEAGLATLTAALPATN